MCIRDSYFDGLDVTKWEVLDSIARERGLHSISSIDSLLRPSSLEADMAEAEVLGAAGYPKLIIATTQPDGAVEHIPIATGFNRAYDIRRKLAVLLPS